MGGNENPGERGETRKEKGNRGNPSVSVRQESASVKRDHGAVPPRNQQFNGAAGGASERGREGRKRVLVGGKAA